MKQRINPPYNDKSPIKKEAKNIRIVSLNSQGRKLEECVKYKEDHKTDILCVQESEIPSNSFFRFGEYVCITSTDLKGGENHPPRITKAVPEDCEPQKDVELENLGNRKTCRRISEQKTGESTVDYLVRKIQEKASTQDDVEQYFETFYKSAGKENIVGKTFTSGEIGEAFVICMGNFDATTKKGKGKGKGKKGKGKGKKANFIMEHHGVMFMYHKDMEKSRIWLKQLSG